MKQKRKLGRKLLSFLLTLAMLVGLMPGMGVTAYAASKTVTWNGSDITLKLKDKSFTKDDITFAFGQYGASTKTFDSGGTFTTESGKFTKIEVTSKRIEISGEDWSGNTSKMTWTGDASSSVTYSGIFMGGDGLEIVFTIETADEKTKETTPTTTFTATGADTGTLSGVTDGMKYSLDETSWTDITSSTDINLTGLSAGTINVVKKGNGTTTIESDPQSITVTKAETPNLTVTQPTVVGGKGTVATTTSHEYSSDNGSTWTTCTANQEFAAGTYLIRVKASGTVLASGNQTVTINSIISVTVTFKVVNGSWNEGEGEAATADKTVTLTRNVGDALKLSADQIPAVGNRPSETYKTGSWNTTPSTETEITDDTTYTYTYAQKEAAEVTNAPTAKELTYSGSAQELVNAGTATGGTMNYAIGSDATTAPTEGWGASIPTATDVGTYYVWYKAVGDQNHTNSEPKCIKVEIKAAPKPSPAPEKKVSGTLLAKMTAKGKTNLVLSWNKVKGVQGYDVFFVNCSKKKPKLTASVKGNNKVKRTFRKLKKNTPYKAYVKAWVKKNGKKTYVRTSPVVHAYTTGGTKHYTNVRSVTVNKKKIILKAGRSCIIKANLNKLYKGRKLMPKIHTAALRYVSTSPGVAKVTKRGRIKGLKKGKCCVYVIAHNGVSTKIDVIIK